MPAIGDMQYGYDTAGVEAYIEAIQTEALQLAKNAVEDISTIKTCCENEWEGRARENFVMNLEKDAKYVSEQFDVLYNTLKGEIHSLNAAMANKDEELIQG